MTGDVPELDPSACRELLEKQPGCMIIDVRTPDEYEASHIADAVNIDLSSRAFLETIEKFDRTGTYLVCCRRGGRAARAVRMMRELGFTTVYNLSGGIDNWKIQGLPVKGGASS